MELSIRCCKSFLKLRSADINPLRRQRVDSRTHLENWKRTSTLIGLCIPAESIESRVPNPLSVDLSQNSKWRGATEEQIARRREARNSQEQVNSSSLDAASLEPAAKYVCEPLVVNPRCHTGTSSGGWPLSQRWARRLRSGSHHRRESVRRPGRTPPGPRRRREGRHPSWWRTITPD